MYSPHNLLHLNLYGPAKQRFNPALYHTIKTRKNDLNNRFERTTRDTTATTRRKAELLRERQTAALK